MPCGLDHVVPRQHEILAKSIVAERGALVSEYPRDRRPTRWTFVGRDRIQAALSGAVVVGHAEPKGGALHAARAARRAGIPVLVPPGGVEAVGEGAWELVRRGGAQVVDPAAGVLEALDDGGSSPAPQLGLFAAEPPEPPRGRR